MAADADGLLVFPGHNNVPGLCHLRCYRPGLDTYVIVGELADNPGAFASVVIEHVAVAIQQTIMQHQDEPFELITHHHQGGLPVFLRVEFDPISDSVRPPLPGGIDDEQDIVLARPEIPHPRFAYPRWSPIADIHQHIGETVGIWPPEQYTAQHLFGNDGIAVREQVAAGVRNAGAEFRAIASEWQ